MTSTATRDFAQARKAYDEIARQTPKEAYAYVDLGRACEKAEDAKCAVENYLRATQLDPNYATAYLRVAVLYTRQQEYQSAASALDKAESIYTDTGLAEGRAEVLYRRGYMMRAVGNNAEARSQLQQSLNLARANGYETQQINALLQLSAVASNENDAKGAQAYAREAVGLAQSNGMENLVALSLVDLGVTFYLRGDYAEAEKYYKQGLEFAERNKAQRVRAKALVNLGSLRISQGETDEGVRYVEQALAFYQPGGYRKESSQALAMLGRANRQKGNYAEALKAFEQQLELAERVSDPAQTSLAHTEIGNVLIQQEKYAEALQHFDESYRLEKSLGGAMSIGYSMVIRADALWRLGRYEEARGMLAQAAAIAGKTDGGSRDLLASVSLTDAHMALSERRFADAKAKGQQVLALVGEQNKQTASQAKQVIALAQAFTGAATAGGQICREALDLAKRVGDPWLFSNAQLAYAETLLEGGDAQGALTNALEAQESFARAGQRESEWRAWLVAAGSAARAGKGEAARHYASRAASCLEELQRAWGGEVFNTYQARPDVQLRRRRLGELSAGARPA
ncbi:MAG: tetratricopeptide repeat protein [Acidobacteria bacterium]|nr:tetratricopeptide repeat protein [Acidobacteriota bacterium]